MPQAHRHTHTRCRPHRPSDGPSLPAPSASCAMSISTPCAQLTMKNFMSCMGTMGPDSVRSKARFISTKPHVCMHTWHYQSAADMLLTQCTIMFKGQTHLQGACYTTLRLDYRSTRTWAAVARAPPSTSDSMLITSSGSCSDARSSAHPRRPSPAASRTVVRTHAQQAQVGWPQHQAVKHRPPLATVTLER